MNPIDIPPEYASPAEWLNDIQEELDKEQQRHRERMAELIDQLKVATDAVIRDDEIAWQNSPAAQE